MLFDILGIALAFASIMLFFSIIVTTLVEAIQKFMNFRYRNLRYGLEKVADHVEGISKEKYKKGLDKVLTFGNHEQLSFISGFVGITKLEITAEELAQYIKTNVDENVETVSKEAVQVFEDIEKYMSQRYQRVVHSLSIIVGVTLAFVFQLNSFEILKQVSMDEKVREAYIELYKETSTVMASGNMNRSFSVIAKESLEKLAKNHEDLRGEIEEVSGESNNIDEAIDEFKLVIQSKSVISDYRKLMSIELEQDEQNTKIFLKELMAVGTAYNFSIFPNGSAYYLSINNILGIFVSGILISLGAPFWFNIIQNISSMRGGLKKEKGKRKKEKR